MNKKTLAVSLIALAVAAGGIGFFLSRDKSGAAPTAISAEAASKEIQETTAWLEKYKAAAAVRGVTMGWGAITADSAGSHVTDMKWSENGKQVSVAKADFQDVVINAEGKVTRIGTLGLHGVSIMEGNKSSGTLKTVIAKDIDVAALEAAYQAAGRGLPRPPMSALTVTDILLTHDEGNEIKADSFDFTAKMNPAGVVETMSVKLANLYMPKQTEAVPSGQPDIDAALRSIGVENPALTVSVDYKADLAEKTISVDALKIDFSGKSDITAIATIGVDPAALTKPETAEPAMRGATLNALSITVADHGLANALYDATAKAEKRTADEIKTDMKAGLQQIASAGPTLEAFVKAVESFIDKPGTLIVTAKPAQPQAFTVLFGAAVMDPESLAKSINLTAEAK